MKEEHEKILDRVKKAIPDKEIMNELGIKTKAALKKLYYDALVEAGKIKDITTARQAKKQEHQKNSVSVTKRKTISISKKILDDLGFQEGDRFTVSKRKDSIILRKTNE